MPDTIQRLDNLTVVGVVLALVGALLALIPYLESLFVLPTEQWAEPVLMGLVAVAALVGTVLAVRGLPALGGLTVLIAGILLAVLGPVAAGVLTLVGGVLLFLSAEGRAVRVGREEPLAHREVRREERYPGQRL